MLPVELVDALTADGVELNGAFLAAQPGAGAARPAFDAVLMMHGVANTFYDAFFRSFADGLAARGYPTLRANNRGHDIVHRGRGAQPYLGAAFERIPDCLHDWRAWLDLLAARGFGRILLWGHSLGAVKSAYYLARAADARVRGCVLASPPRFSYERWIVSPRSAEFRAHLERAQALIDAGEPAALMPVTMPVPFVIGAQAYLEKYGPGAAFDVFAQLEAIPCPVLAFTGARELDQVEFRDHPDGYAAAAQRKHDLTHVLVPDGDHHYRGVQPWVLEELLAWMEKDA